MTRLMTFPRPRRACLIYLLVLHAIGAACVVQAAIDGKVTAALLLLVIAHGVWSIFQHALACTRDAVIAFELRDERLLAMHCLDGRRLAATGPPWLFSLGNWFVIGVPTSSGRIRAEYGPHKSVLLGVGDLSGRDHYQLLRAVHLGNVQVKSEICGMRSRTEFKAVWVTLMSYNMERDYTPDCACPRALLRTTSRRVAWVVYGMFLYK